MTEERDAGLDGGLAALHLAHCGRGAAGCIGHGRCVIDGREWADGCGIMEGETCGLLLGQCGLVGG